MDCIRKVFLDASALLAWILYPDKVEPGGERISEYLKRPEHQRYSNELCLTEVLSRLKWMRHYKQITDPGYFMQVNLLMRRIDHQTLYVSDFNYWKKEFSDKALELVRKHQNKIDFIDAMQIVDVLYGPYRIFAGPSRTLLITMDGKLRDAAKAEEVEVWFPPDETDPDQLTTQSS